MDQTKKAKPEAPGHYDNNEELNEKELEAVSGGAQNLVEQSASQSSSRRQVIFLVPPKEPVAK